MALSAFDDKSKKPRPSDLKRMLGRTSVHWGTLIRHVADKYAPLDETWSFSGAQWGWSLRLKQKKRTVLYMTPCKGYFLVGLVLGEKAVKAAHECTLPDPALSVIDSARKYAEGRGVRLEIRSRKDLDHTKKLAAVKMAN